MRRSSIVAALVIASLTGGTAAAEAKSKLSMTAAKEETKRIARIDASENDFGFNSVTCRRVSRLRADCRYEAYTRHTDPTVFCSRKVDVRLREGAKRPKGTLESLGCRRNQPAYPGYTPRAASSSRRGTLTVAAAKARTRQVMAQERDNKWGAREKIGGDFTVTLKYCNLVHDSAFPMRARCSYWITSVNPTSKAPDGSDVRRRCIVTVAIRKSKKTKRVTHTRTAGKCYEPQPPVVGPPVHG